MVSELFLVYSVGDEMGRIGVDYGDFKNRNSTLVAVEFAIFAARGIVNLRRDAINESVSILLLFSISEDSTMVMPLEHLSNQAVFSHGRDVSPILTENQS